MWEKKLSEITDTGSVTPPPGDACHQPFTPPLPQGIQPEGGASIETAVIDTLFTSM